jgi:hypothetical protein
MAPPPRRPAKGKSDWGQETMYDFEWFERAVSNLKSDLDEGRISQSEFDEQMSALQRRKAAELEFFKRHPPETYGEDEDGILWA